MLATFLDASRFFASHLLFLATTRNTRPIKRKSLLDVQTAHVELVRRLLGFGVDVKVSGIKPGLQIFLEGDDDDDMLCMSLSYANVTGSIK